MGFELEAESALRSRPFGRDVDDRIALLTRRWQEAETRLMHAQVSWRALRGEALPGDPRLIGAQLKLAQARHRRHELELEIGRLEEELESGSA